MTAEGQSKPEYFYNTRTKMVEKGRLSSWEYLMGPYDTPEQAENAIEIARKRNAAWDDDDAKWTGEEDE